MVRQVRLFLQFAALVVVAPSLMGATSTTVNFESRVLSAQNRERSSMGVEPLMWSYDLANSAQRWADYLATTGRFEHEPEKASEAEGENLWAGTKGHYSIEDMVDGWVQEKRFFRPGLFPNNSSTGRHEDIGHYTQLMWRQTRHVGCAVATGQREDVLVCRYNEAGNYRGERPF